MSKLKKISELLNSWITRGNRTLSCFKTCSLRKRCRPFQTLLGLILTIGIPLYGEVMGNGVFGLKIVIKLSFWSTSIWVLEEAMESEDSWSVKNIPLKTQGKSHCYSFSYFCSYPAWGYLLSCLWFWRRNYYAPLY